MNPKKSIPVSQLALYYSDRELFRKAKGGAFDKKLAKRGTREHARAGKSSNKSSNIIRPVFLTIIGFICYLLFKFS